MTSQPWLPPAAFAEAHVARLHEPVGGQRLGQLMQEAVAVDRKPAPAEQGEHADAAGTSGLMDVSLSTLGSARPGMAPGVAVPSAYARRGSSKSRPRADDRTTPAMDHRAMTTATTATTCSNEDSAAAAELRLSTETSVFTETKVS